MRLTQEQLSANLDCHLSELLIFLDGIKVDMVLWVDDSFERLWLCSDWFMFYGQPRGLKSDGTLIFEPGQISTVLVHGLVVCQRSSQPGLK